jgi:hypothetical protein
MARHLIRLAAVLVLSSAVAGQTPSPHAPVGGAPVTTERRSAAAGQPPARAHHSIVYDAANRRVILAGGSTTHGGGAATWSWNGAAWTKVNDDGPPARYFGAVAYDDARDGVVMFGGRPGLPNPDANDTWEWDGASWKQVVAATEAARRLPVPSQDETAEQMADRMLGVIGGRARWAAVTNTVNDSQQNLVEDPTVLRVVITMDFTRPRFRIDTTAPDLRVVRVIDGSRSWMRTRNGTVQDVPDDLMKNDLQWYAGHVYRTLHRIAARDAALSLSINSQRRLEVHEGGARILWFALDRRGEPYAFGAHGNEAGTVSGPWDFVHEGIHHPRWVAQPDGTWRASIKTLAVNVPLDAAMFARPKTTADARE